jgi:cytochrome c5
VRKTPPLASRRAAFLVLAATGVAWTVSAGLQGASRETPAQSPAVSQQEMPPGEGSQIVRTRCLVCHGPELIVQQRLSRDGWGRELDKMITWGAVVDEQEKGTLMDYLSVHFSEPSEARAVPASGPGADLVATRCLACHDARLIEQQRLSAAGWAREVDKMVGWGASLSDSETSLLIEYLAGLRSPILEP